MPDRSAAVVAERTGIRSWRKERGGCGSEEVSWNFVRKAA